MTLPWIKRTTEDDYYRAMTHGNSLGSVGGVEVFYDRVPDLTGAEIADQFSAVYPEYEVNVLGKYVKVGRHIVVTSDMPKGLWEAKRRCDFDGDNG